MNLSEETIKEFKKLYKKKEGKELSDQEAREIVINLLLLFDAIYRPIPEQKRNAVQEFLIFDNISFLFKVC